MCLISKYTVEDQTTTDSEKHRCDDRDDPVNTGKVACPAEPEEGNWEGDGAHDGRRHLHFWCDIAVCIKIFYLPAVFPVKIGWDDEAAG